MAKTIITLVTRISMGWLFASSGYAKWHNLDQVIGYFSSLGIPLAHLQAPLVAGTELIFGVALIIGLRTRLTSLPLMVIMLVALLTAKRSDITDFSTLLETSEFLYLLLLGWLASVESQCLSVNRLFFRSNVKATCKDACC